jgi:hypothetical protein
MKAKNLQWRSDYQKLSNRIRNAGRDLHRMNQKVATQRVAKVFRQELESDIEKLRAAAANAEEIRMIQALQAQLIELETKLTARTLLNE